MKSYIYLAMLFITASALCSDINFTGKWHSWDETPKKDQLYMITSSEYAFDRDFHATCILQRWGCADPYELCHQKGWIEVDQQMLLQLIRLGFRVVFLPNGKADLPYLNLECKYLHTPPEVDGPLDILNEH